MEAQEKERPPKFNNMLYIVMLGLQQTTAGLSRQVSRPIELCYLQWESGGNRIG